jgi:hypothetical protein
VDQLHLSFVSNLERDLSSRRVLSYFSSFFFYFLSTIRPSNSEGFEKALIQLAEHHHIGFGTKRWLSSRERLLQHR